MQFCLEVWGTDYSRIKETCILAENLGYHGFYYGESLADIDLDCWTAISALASDTKSIRLGPVITYILPQYRSIMLLAKQSVALQDISHGRLEFRTGAGATLQYAAQWWYPYGIDYPSGKERVAMLDEGLNVLQMLWNGSSVTFRGKYFQVNGVSLQKPVNVIPVTVAAKRPKMMAIAAKYADIWESSYISPERFRALNTQFNDIAKKYSRNVKRSIELDVIIADSESELKHKQQMFAMERGPNVLSQVLRNGLVGTPDTIAARVAEYRNSGVDQFFLAFTDPFDSRALELFIRSVK
jgi:alkanesulfonate monooxygenase